MRKHHNHQAAMLQRRQNIETREAMRSIEEKATDAVNEIAQGVYAEYTPQLTAAAGNVEELKQVLWETAEAMWNAIDAAGYNPEQFGFARYAKN